jgi:hypothetical protein
MNEANLRKWHRRLGIVLALFIGLQAASGVVLNSESLSSLATLAVWGNVLHRGWGNYGTVYRWVLGLGLIGMAATGSLISYNIWRRTTKKVMVK